MFPGRAELARKLVEITGMLKVFFSNSLVPKTNDGAIETARLAAGRKNFVAFTHGFHGRTLGSLSVA